MKPRFDDCDVAKRIEIRDEFVKEFDIKKKKKVHPLSLLLILVCKVLKLNLYFNALKF